MNTELSDDKIYIPKIIHQTYKSIHELPDIWKNSPSSWRMQHPQWTYKFWSDSDNELLVKTHFPWFLKTYNKMEYAIQKADVIRYMFLYQYGGLYVDCDIEAKKP